MTSEPVLKPMTSTCVALVGFERLIDKRAQSLIQLLERGARKSRRGPDGTRPEVLGRDSQRIGLRFQLTEGRHSRAGRWIPPFEPRNTTANDSKYFE